MEHRRCDVHSEVLAAVFNKELVDCSLVTAHAFRILDVGHGCVDGAEGSEVCLALDLRKVE